MVWQILSLVNYCYHLSWYLVFPWQRSKVIQHNSNKLHNVHCNGREKPSLKIKFARSHPRHLIIFLNGSWHFMSSSLPPFSLPLSAPLSPTSFFYFVILVKCVYHITDTAYTRLSILLALSHLLLRKNSYDVGTVTIAII